MGAPAGAWVPGTGPGHERWRGAGADCPGDGIPASAGKTADSPEGSRLNLRVPG